MKGSDKHIPLLAITMGDPAGIGPEIAVKLFVDENVFRICNPLLVGNAGIIRKAAGITGLDLAVNEIDDPANAKFEPANIDVFHIGDDDISGIHFGEISAKSGDLAFRSVKASIDLAMEGKVDGIVTGPINKEAIHKAGYQFSGHTEIFAHFTNTSKYAMLLADKDFRVIHVTTHVALRNACDLIKKDRIMDVIDLLNEVLQKMGISKPRIGVAGLNPHSGDGGIFGTEEKEEIEPAITETRKTGILADGPVPPDILFVQAAGGKYDGCVAMYHDQGHIPFKFKSFKWNLKESKIDHATGVNITVGLPIIRTSVDHGTAFDIAGKGIASADALFQAVEYAVKLVNE
jgi:4-hydroxythreonine-4-phosphate dehydrogenase